MQKLHQLKVQLGTTSGTGKEPKWDKFDEELRDQDVLRSFNFYSYHFDYKDAAELIGNYLIENERNDEHKLWKRVPLRSVPDAIGWYARMISKGYPATKEELTRVEDAISHAITLIPVKVVTITDEAELAAKKANVQEVMREKAALLGGELEYMLDNFIGAGIPAKHKFTPIDLMKIANVLPQHIPDLIEHWEQVRNEFKEAHAGSDKDLVESYGDYNKIQLRNLAKFADLIVTDLNSYVAFKKSSRAMPKRKIKTPKQQVMKLKHAREFKELNLKSVKAEKIIGAKEMFVYSPKKRKLHYYVADEAAGNALMVKNNTIIGFDPNRTGMKTIRRPKEQVNALMKASRPNSRKMFKGIRAVEAKLSGRFADDIIILKVF